MTTYCTGLQIDNKTSMAIVSGAIKYNNQNFEAGSTQLEAFFPSFTTSQPAKDWVELTGPMSIRPNNWKDTRVEIYERWGYDPITISLTFSDGHVITFDDIQRDAYNNISPQGVAITQAQGSNKIDNMNVTKWTRHDVPYYDQGLLTFTIHQDTVPLANERWMAKLNGDVPLCDINLPGSHDSAAIFVVNTPWRDQDATITEQLRGGIRALDVRLKVLSTGTGMYQFLTCHGSFNAGPVGVYQSLESLLDECATFLRLNSTESIVMSIKMDDWDGHQGASGAVLTALRTLLDSYPVLTGLTAMPTLRQARSHIYLFNRINTDPNLGVPLDIVENQEAYSPSTAFPIYVQDHYKYVYPDYPLFDALADKLSRVKNTFALQSTGVKWNFVSAVWGADAWQPIAVDINVLLLTWLGLTPAVDRPNKLGWCFFDMCTTPMHTKSSSTTLPKTLTWPEMIISSNFSYGNQGGATFSVL
jgi:hypothetical protein